jgi:hypothetical protein
VFGSKDGRVPTRVAFLREPAEDFRGDRLGLNAVAGPRLDRSQPCTILKELIRET